jgi:hypothetical protein
VAAVTSPQTLWVPGKLPGLNELIGAAKGAGGTGRAYSRLKRNWTEAVWALAKAARLAPYDPGARVYMGFVWYEADRRRDMDNIAAGGRKLILDGLVKAGVLATDGWGGVAGWTDSFEVVSVRDIGVRIQMFEASA